MIMRVARAVAWVLMALAHPAYYTACVLFVLRWIDALVVNMSTIACMAAFPIVAIVFDDIVRVISSPQTCEEPGGSPGTEESP